jgi:Domain of unknown function (DUF6484)
VNRVSREPTLANVKYEEVFGATPDEGLLPSLIAARDARTPTGRFTRSSTGRKQRSKQRRRRAGLRQKPLPRRSPCVRSEVALGRLAGINDAGDPLVLHPRDPSGKVVLARTAVPIVAEQIDREVVLGFESGDLSKPIVLGVLRSADSPEPPAAQPTIVQPIVEATLDGDRLVLSARNEIVLQCGEASITITRAGKVLIRGAYLLSRSSGVNRIKGGSVQIN